MARGPAPTPTNLKILTGNRGKRPLNKDEPKPKLEIPRKPKTLQGAAAEEWKRITPKLADLGLLTNIDRVALELYCATYKIWVDAMKRVNDDGMLQESEKGYLYQHPALGIANKAMEKMQRLLCEFGMTPASRTRIKIDKPKKEEGFDF